MPDDIAILKKEVKTQKKILEEFSNRLKNIEEKLEIEEPQEEIVEEPQEVTKQEHPINLFKVFGVIGAIMILLGFVYFYKYAVDQGWIGITGRITLGILVSFIFIGIGFFFHKKEYTKYSQILISIGLGIQYFTFFATYHFKEYRTALGMNLTFNTILLLMVMGAGMLFGMRLNAKFIVYASLLLGYLAAFLSGIDGSTLHILIYILIINLVVITMAKMKAWYIGIPAQVLTYIAYSIWYIKAYSDPQSILNQTSVPVLITFGFLFIYYILFTILSFIQSSDIKEGECIAIGIINTICLAGFGLGIVNKYLSSFNGVYLILIAGLTLFIGYMSKKYEFKNIFDLHFIMTCVLVANRCTSSI